MKRRLFEDLVVSRPVGGPRARGVAVPVSMGLHGAVATVVVMIPVLTSQALPKVALPPLEPPVISIGAPAGSRVPVNRRPAPNAGRPRPAAAVLPLATDPAPPVTSDGLSSDSSFASDPGPNGTCTAHCDSTGPIGEGPGPGEGPIGAPTTIVRPGGEIQPPTKLRHVSPVYPDLAKRSGTSGVVIVECVIDTAGRVVDTHVLKGHPLLDAAAVAAVQQWVYTPTRLNGEPVAVIMTVTVRFELRR